MATLVPARTAHAQSSDQTDVTPPGHGVDGASTLGQAPPAAGSVEGLISADPTTGAARASLSFELPRARGDAQPSLSLSYSSSAGMGLAGMGFSLNIPSIERRNSSGFPRFIDGTPGPPSSTPLTDPDDFVFAGQPLVAVCVIGAQGTCSATTETFPVQPEWIHLLSDRERQFHALLLLCRPYPLGNPISVRGIAALRRHWRRHQRDRGA